MGVFIMSCRCGVHPEREWTFYVDREMSVSEARVWIAEKTRGYADTRFIIIRPLKVESV